MSGGGEGVRVAAGLGGGASAPAPRLRQLTPAPWQVSGLAPAGIPPDYTHCSADRTYASAWFPNLQWLEFHFELLVRDNLCRVSLFLLSSEQCD